MATTKIDTIKLGTSEYEIDLKSTATPTISSLTTSTLTVNGNSNLSDVNCNGNITLPHITGVDPDGTIKTRYIKNINFNPGGITTEFPLTISSNDNLDLNASGSLDISSGSYMSLSAGGDGQDNSIDMDNEGIRLSTKGVLSLECGNFKTTADNSHLGGIKPWYSTTGTSTYSGKTYSTTSPAINSATTTAGRFYPIGVDANGRAFVNVPWVDTDTHVTVDSSLSSTSTNPVQNKVINSALSNKQDKLVSGTNIKSINNQSILSSGNLHLLEPFIQSITTGKTGCWESTFFNSNTGTNTGCRIVYGTADINQSSFHDQSITFAKSMASSNYAVILTPVISDSTASREVYTSVYSRSTTGFVCNGHVSNKTYKITKLHYIAIYVS